MLLTISWLLPLAGFVVELAASRWMPRTSRLPAWFAVGCISTGFLLSLTALGIWSFTTAPAVVSAPTAIAAEPVEHPTAKQPTAKQPTAEQPESEDTESERTATTHADPLARAWSGTFYRIAQFGHLDLSLDYYIDGLTLVMFAMVTLIATCIHLFAIGYLGGELNEELVDHAVTLPDGSHFHRPGRFSLFFAYLSLFCFAMLGLVLAGNLFQIFVFWELVGVCSYLLIGFYVERPAANHAANKAFIVNRVGDFGFLIGLMILCTGLGTLHFASPRGSDRAPGLYQLVRTPQGELTVTGAGREKTVSLNVPDGAPAKSLPYWLLTAAGLGLVAGCLGKSAQFPLQTWLPDAMEGPTPVSALVHSATMVAAGVYLIGRIYPFLTPEVLLTIAYGGCLTLFIGATIALVMTDIKQVLAFSTISQLGYMMLAMGVGGWMAGLFHLITHAFFKSLLFLTVGSVIHGCGHEQNMERMGGLRTKMPFTCWTMFLGVIAICGLAVPMLPPLPWIGTLAFSGYHSKDSILATALAFASSNPVHSLLFLVPLLTAGLTAFYMFRMWFLIFFGAPRDVELRDLSHDAPRVMQVPMFILAIFAVTIGVAGEQGPLVALLRTAEPVAVTAGMLGAGSNWTFPGEQEIHQQHLMAGGAALLTAFLGTGLAILFYAVGAVDPRSIASQFPRTTRFLQNRWEFDPLYEQLFARPVRIVANWCVLLDRHVLDSLLDRLAQGMVRLSGWDRRFDEAVVDRVVTTVGTSTWNAGELLRKWQTGRLRHYVTSITFSVVLLFILLFLCLPGR